MILILIRITIDEKLINFFLIYLYTKKLIFLIHYILNKNT